MVRNTIDTMALRSVRLVVLATISTVLAALAHSLGAGRLPGDLIAATPPVALAGSVIFTAAAVGVLGWRRRPAWVVVLVLILAQGVQHLALLTAGSGTADVSALTHGGHGGHAATAGGAGIIVAGQSGHGHHSVTMAAGHLLAALVTAALLGHGEHVVTLMLTWLSWLAPTPAVTPAAVPTRIRRWTVPTGPRPLYRLLRACGVGLRGPPACCVATPI